MNDSVTSDRKPPPMEEQPGPPLSQSTSGSEEERLDSTNM